MAPYRRGERVAYLSEHRDGIQVQQATVLAIEPSNDQWSVRTTAGTEMVNERGEGPQLIPLDAEVQAMLDQRGRSFVLHPAREETQHHQMRARSFDRAHERRRQTERDRDLGRDR